MPRDYRPTNRRNIGKILFIYNLELAKEIQKGNKQVQKLHPKKSEKMMHIYKSLNIYPTVFLIYY